MKKHSICILTIYATCLTNVHSTPYEYQELNRKRNQAILKINKTYAIELTKLKLKYTKSGNLDDANLMDDALEKLKKESEELTSKKPSFIGKTYTKPGSKKPFKNPVDFTFLDEGQVKRSDGQLAGWKFSGDQKIVVWLSKGSNPMTWTFDETYKTAQVYSPYHKTTVKSSLVSQQK